VTGAVDPLFQAATGLRYDRDLTALTAGPQIGYFLAQAQIILEVAFGRNSPNTNTAERNGVMAAYRMLGVPALNYALSAMPAGPVIGAVAGGAMQVLSGRQAAEGVADAVAGERGQYREASALR
ncbi:MAG: hypothetical protein KDA57_19895, partial [Planctomycetales bacterium]|nr:hypothetical protein [Planctomycetales bacterium]